MPEFVAVLLKVVLILPVATENKMFLMVFIILTLEVPHLFASITVIIAATLFST